MKKEDLKQFIVPSLYVLSVLAFISSLYFLNGIMNPNNHIDDDFIYVSDSIFDDSIPVNNTEEETIGKPFIKEGVNLVKNFYDYKQEKDIQTKSIFYYESTYIQNSGVLYSSDSEFEVVSIYSGTVIDVLEDELLGKVVQIRHNNDIISYYQSLSTVDVKKDDVVTKGQVIGKSGTNKISKDSSNELLLEVSYKGQFLNPVSFFDKKINEIE